MNALRVQICLVALFSFSAFGQTANERVAIGAIRWDAWHGDASEVGRAVQKTLSPQRWQTRLPFFAEVGADGAATIDADRDETMTREIEYAKKAGIDYWAFCAYDPENAMSRGLRRYLKNPNRDAVRFCMIADVNHWQPDAVAAEAARFAELMKLPNYQTVLGGRPLCYILNLDLESNEKRWTDAGGFRRAVAALRQATRDRGLADPYCATMIPWPDKAKAFADAAGCDAISAYAVQAGGKGAAFGELAAYVEEFWNRSQATGAKVIPLAMTGWDRRPRVETPVFWEQNQGWDAEIERFYQSPKPTEIAAHIRKAVDWTRTHPAAAEAQTVIVYAWNEHDEGGWLCPTRGEGDARVRAMADVFARP